ncbi:hypothetical protein DFH09DRAFT_1026515 [Mycena vulgaris]|nr:hypothetical protein DFH09DRAFT_1026515 [Mycena vulgaris]
MPPPPPPPQHMYAPPPHYYNQGPYGYEPAPYMYWGHPGAGPMGGPTEEGQQGQWWPMQQNGQQQQPEPPRQQPEPPRMQQSTPPQRPPPPAESGAVSVSASLPGGLSALGGMATGSTGGVVFGSVDTGLAALGGGVGQSSAPNAASSSTSTNASTSSGLPFNAGIPSSATMAVLSSSSPPPVLPASASAPPREPAWRTATEPVWPVDPAWTSGTDAAAWPSGTGSRPPVFAIGVSPRARARRLAEDPSAEVVDLTVAPGELGGRWEFGTTRVAEQRGYSAYPYGAYGGGPGGGYGYDGQPAQPMYGGYAPPPPMDGMLPPQGMMPPMGMMVGPPPQMMGMGGMGMNPYGMPPPPQMQGMIPPANGGAPMDGDGAAPHSSPRPGAGAVMNGNGGGAERRPGESSEWEVKDFGYGFGGGYAREEGRNAYVPRGPPEHPPHPEDRPRDMDYPIGRTRRGSYSGGGYNYEPRGGYAGRRGRGGYRGGRYPRGGFQQQPRPPPPQQQPAPQAPPFNITPPPRFTPLMPEGYYPAPYMPTGYDYPQPPAQHLAPVPTPRTRLSFPIDRLRQEILSQLEFYLSPDNMATDLYLRQQMDSRGWVRIEVLASFKRVQSKTSDVNLVRDVLGLSDYAEIRGEWVRSTEGWEKFVLPTAQPSVVEAESPYSLLLQADKAGHASIDDAEEVDDEDEEDVVFVMGREVQAWSPERPR